MKKILVFVLIFSCFWISGCSVPTAMAYRQLYSFTKEEKKIRGTFGKKDILVRDFRENERYDEDVAALKEEVEKYILAHPDLSEPTKANLRELRVTQGATQEEVELLLGKPDKIVGETWIYQISKFRAYMVFIIPVFLVHEGYRIYFQDNLLVNIKRHSLKQVVHEGYGTGVRPPEKKSDQ